MYSVFIITNKKKFVLATYQDFSPELSDQTKLQLILNGPTIPLAVFEDFFKSPDLFSIETFKTGLSNALDASLVMQEESKLIGTDKPSIKPSKTKSTTRKLRTKKD